MVKRINEIDEIFTDFLEISGVLAVLITSLDGFLIGSKGFARVDMEAVASESALILGASSKLGDFFGFKECRICTLNFDVGQVFVADAGETAVSIITDNNVNIAVIRAALKRNISSLHQLLSNV